MWGSGLNPCLEYQHPMRVLVQALIAPLATQLCVNCTQESSGKWPKYMCPCKPWGRPRWIPGLMASPCPSPGHFDYLESKTEDQRSHTEDGSLYHLSCK